MPSYVAGPHGCESLIEPFASTLASVLSVKRCSPSMRVTARPRARLAIQPARAMPRLFEGLAVHRRVSAVMVSVPLTGTSPLTRFTRCLIDGPRARDVARPLLLLLDTRSVTPSPGTPMSSGLGTTSSRLNSGRCCNSFSTGDAQRPKPNRHRARREGGLRQTRRERLL